MKHAMLLKDDPFRLMDYRLIRIDQGSNDGPVYILMSKDSLWDRGIQRGMQRESRVGKSTSSHIGTFKSVDLPVDSDCKCQSL